jgi:hypothetical protein
VARVDVDDDLPADNSAYAVVDAEHPLRVLLFTRGNFYLESALAALPGVNVVKRESTPVDDLARLASTHDVLVFDGIAAPRLPPGNFLLINTVAPGLPFSDAGRVVRPQILGRGASALMRDVDLTAVHIEAARRVVVAERAAGLQRLFWSSSTDLALAWLQDDVKGVYLGFDLARSNFAREIAFPLFFSRSLEWLRPRGEGFMPSHIAAGSTRTIQARPSEAQATVRTPVGDVATLPVTGGAVRFDATSDAGIYEYSAGDRTGYFAVSLTDARESDVNQRWVPGPRDDRQLARDSAQARVPLWPYLLFLVLILLSLEWCVWVWSRRHA